MTTLVTSFLQNINNRKNVDYLEHGKFIINLDIPKIIFINEECMPQSSYNTHYTHFIPVKKEDIYLYEYINNNISLPAISDGAKDTIDYIFLMCNKTEFIRRAIELDYFNTGDEGQFIWVDFGINYIFKLGMAEFEQKIKNSLTGKNYNRIRIGSIWDLNCARVTDIYNAIAWYFAGGVFGGNKESLLIFAEKTKQKCIQIIKEKNHIMWEVNIWYLIYKENIDLFYPYQCDHDESLITNY